MDVRIVAATNKDLEREVSKGRFREDLFYRLNVVRLHIADLKDRAGDLQQLADQFLERFSTEYDRVILGFDSSGRAALHKYQWPGNVRELKNRVLRACILADDEYITAADLGLAVEGRVATESLSESWSAVAGGKATTDVVPANTVSPDTAPPGTGPLDPVTSGTVQTDGAVPVDALPVTTGSGEDTARGAPALEQLAAAVAQQILDCSSREPLPFGRWLFEDLLHEASTAAQGVARQAAQLIGIPETTFRRRLRTIEPEERTAHWAEIRTLLAKAVENGEGGAEGLASRVESLMLTQIAEVHPKSTVRGAALLGVSAPTFRGKLAKHRARLDFG